MCVGGGTIHYSGLSWRFHESDFRVKSEDGPLAGTTIEDWPISYDDMEPFYEKAEWTVGISGKGWSNPFDPPRKRDYPVGPAARNSPGAALERGARKLGLHPFPTPLAILTGDYDAVRAASARACALPTAARWAPSPAPWSRCCPRPWPPAAWRSAPSVWRGEITLDRQGRASGVTYFNGEGEEEHQPARLVVMAAGGVETARLLLMSESARFPQGLSNRSGLVGKNLMFHSPGVTLVVTFPEPLDGHKGTSSTRCSRTSTRPTPSGDSSAAASCTHGLTAAIPSSWRSGPSTASVGARSTRTPCARPGVITCTATAPARAFRWRATPWTSTPR